MSTNIQNDFLDKLQNERKPVTVITINGFQMKGFIEGHDQDTILVDVYGRKQLIYKNAISTIIRGEGK